MLKNCGVAKPEGKDFVQQELVKAVADVDENGTVIFFEWTEISTFKNTDPDANWLGVHWQGQPSISVAPSVRPEHGS